MRTSYRFNIKNFRGRFFITIALDWGRRGGCSAADYINASATAFPRLTGRNEWDFEFEQQAQNALDGFKEWLKSRDSNWCAKRRKSYEDNYPIKSLAPN